MSLTLLFFFQSVVCVFFFLKKKAWLNAFVEVNVNESMYEKKAPKLNHAARRTNRLENGLTE